MSNTEREKTVTISLKRYNSLLDSERMLHHLYELGVDNWDGYCSPDDEEEDCEDEE